MANIRVDLDSMIHDGMDVVFRTPCDCSKITGLIIYYPDSNGTKISKEFVFKDAHNNDVSNLSELFASDVLIKVLLDVTNGHVYIQNADTNGYLENKMNRVPDVTSKDNGKFMMVQNGILVVTALTDVSQEGA